MAVFVSRNESSDRLLGADGLLPTAGRSVSISPAPQRSSKAVVGPVPSKRNLLNVQRCCQTLLHKSPTLGGCGLFHSIKDRVARL